MANNFNEIKATVEANLAKIRAAYYAELAANPSAEGIATARANYTTALSATQQNAKQLLANQIPYTADEVKVVNAILELGYSLNQVNLTDSVSPSTATIASVYGLPQSGEALIGGQSCKIVTEYNASLPVRNILSSLESLTGEAYSNFLENTLVDGVPLGKSTRLDVGLTGAGESADAGPGPTGCIQSEWNNKCFKRFEECECPYTLSPRGPNGEIIGDHGEVYLPFDPNTNPLGYIRETVICKSTHTRSVTILCDGMTKPTILENTEYDQGHKKQDDEYEVGGYKPKPYYNPDTPRDPNDPSIGRYEGPIVIGGQQSSRYKECAFLVTDPSDPSKKCTVTVTEHQFCDADYFLEFSNWGMKPCSFTPRWTDGLPPPGWCDSVRQYIREHPEIPMCLPPECKNGPVLSDNGTIDLPIAE